MLPGKLYDFVKYVLEMEDIEVSDDEGGKEPITKMYQVIMVEVAPYVLGCKFTIVIVCMLTLGDGLIELGVEVAE